MAAKDPTIPKRPLTEFAQRYGVFKNETAPQIVNALQGYKSGHTPVSAYKPGESETRTRWKRVIRTHQLQLNSGFPTNFLRALKAYVPTAEADFAGVWEKTNLENSIHPLIAKHQWETLSGCSKQYPPQLLGDGLSGFLVASNPIVWEALEPVLKLTTRYLDNAHLWPWWDALLSKKDSDNKSTKPSPYNDGTTNLFFKLRTSEEVYTQAIPVRNRLMEMAGHWVLRFRSPNRDARDGSPQAGAWWGVTIPVTVAGKASITINSELFRPLLKEDLTEPERVMLVSFAARVLAHEVAHATYKHFTGYIDPRPPLGASKYPSEPYFEDEALNEWYVGRTLIVHLSDVI
ncbi:hypothetical protein V492_03323 [Pseudogymnoascus sp. VKM F-4246]|nr:hypothetical protein V492_03323 [Pseudogymnoascus sp. VKM F-4246]